MVSSSAILVSVALICGVVCSHELPKDFVRCHVEDEACLLKRTNEIIQSHPHGYPELLLQDFEPFRIDDIKFSGNPNGPVNLKLDMSGLTMIGYANLTVLKFSGFKKDPKDLKILSESYNPLLVIKGKYKISGKLLVLPITGEGDITISIKGLQMKTQMKPSVEVRDGKTYLKVANHKLKVKAEQLDTQMTNLFNGDQVLGENMLKVINDNWQLLWDEIEPKFNEQILKANTKIIDSVLNNIAYEDLFIID